MVIERITTTTYAQDHRSRLLTQATNMVASDHLHDVQPLSIFISKAIATCMCLLGDRRQFIRTRNTNIFSGLASMEAIR